MFRLVFCIAVLWLPSSLIAQELPAVNFVRDIRPILAKNCFECHGPDEEHRKGELRLDTSEGAFATHDDRRAFVPKSVEKSESLRRIVSNDDNERMPPPKSGKSLTPEQVELLKRWVTQGAGWSTHWAFETPVRSPAPTVSDVNWSKNEIDQFVLSRLEKEGLKPSPEADKYRLARRVALDLTGLPPPVEFVTGFVNDPSPDAYEKLVDRLLQSNAYGERWARLWLDLARYADTRGYEKDRTRTIWRFRDWTIDAFNSDMPYDQFTREQLAGDLIDNTSPNQLLATAFHRNTMVNEEGGTDDEEFRIAAVKDRVDTTAQVWMGLTLGCAKCHSHKFDPISQREYYQFYAFFNQTADSDRGDEFPTAAIPPKEQQEVISRLNGELAEARKKLETSTPELEAAFLKWLADHQLRSRWDVLKPGTMLAASGSQMTVQDDASILVAASSPAQEKYTVSFPFAATRLASIRLEVIPDKIHPKGGVGRSPNDGNFVLTGIQIAVKSKTGDVTDLPLGRAEADFSQADYPVSLALKNENPKKQGWAVSPQQTKSHTAIFGLKDTRELTDVAELIITLDHQFEFAYPGFSIGRFRISATGDEKLSLQNELPDTILAALNVGVEKRTADQKQTLFKFFVERTPLTQTQRDAITKLQTAIDAQKPVQTPILQELAVEKRRTTQIHTRGNFLTKGETVTAALPAVFPKLSPEAQLNRLGLAQWLTDPNHPLTARVAVNRFWSQFFGIGLVETQEDFGVQGLPPSHPELLDWLATEFVRQGWSMKKLCKLIVMSATYRQSSRVTPELLSKDRFNRLLARGPRFRLEAEMLRDQALAASGLLSSKMYGPSVMPPQPDGIWRSTYNVDKWKTSPGEDKYRRGLYTFIKRTSPYPAMITFDAPSREICTVRRINTNTPLQALVLLNDPVYIEAAQALARKMAQSSGGVDERIAAGFRSVLIRPPEAREMDALKQLYEKRLTFFQKDKLAADKMATEFIGPAPTNFDLSELAALTAVGNVILNLDEVVTRP